MARRKDFEFLEHTADVYIAAYGRSMAEAFEHAALAMFDVMTDVNKIKPEVEDTVEVGGQDEYALLYNWLEALLVKFDVEDMFYTKFEVSDLNKAEKGYQLRAKIWGEKFDPQRHVQKVGVKAVTYHRMEIIKEADKVALKFILDI